MFPITSGATQAYLADLDKSQKHMQQIQSQMSSGRRVQQPADDPAAVTEILQVQGDLGRAQQVQSNLGNIKTVLSSADSALQSAVQAVESAISLATQGATTTTTANQRATLAQQAAALQQTIVSLSRTAVNGKYIFSGDQEDQPAYDNDPTQPGGVKQLMTTTNTGQALDWNGVPMAVGKTAQEIFDARNTNGTPAQENVFTAMQSLVTSLQNNDPAGVAASIDQLHAADQHLNQGLAFYGAAEDRVASATDVAQKFQTAQQARLGELRDADIPTLAIQLNQEQVQNQAALSVESNLLQSKNLFSYLG